MKIKIIENGSLKENCYLLEQDNNYLIVDPGSDFEKIMSFIPKDSKVLAILITHGHEDHTGSLKAFLKIYSCPVFSKNSTEESFYQVGLFKFKVIFTPGHSPDSITFYFPLEKLMFCGDFIFKGSIGRCDLAGGDMLKMTKSIEKIKKYPPDITLYPGHGKFTTLGDEIEKNYFFNS